MNNAWVIIIQGVNWRLRQSPRSLCSAISQQPRSSHHSRTQGSKTDLCLCLMGIELIFETHVVPFDYDDQLALLMVLTHRNLKQPIQTSPIKTSIPLQRNTISPIWSTRHERQQWLRSPRVQRRVQPIHKALPRVPRLQVKKKKTHRVSAHFVTPEEFREYSTRRAELCRGSNRCRKRERNRHHGCRTCRTADVALWSRIGHEPPH